MRAIFGQGVLFDRGELVIMLVRSKHRGPSCGPDNCTKCYVTRALAELDELPPPAAYNRRRTDVHLSQAELAAWARESGESLDPPTELPAFDFSDSVCAECGEKVCEHDND